jgi:hypothetical protein
MEIMRLQNALWTKDGSCPTEWKVIPKIESPNNGRKRRRALDNPLRKEVSTNETGESEGEEA